MSPTEWAAAVVPLNPRLALEVVIILPEIVPFKISLLILIYTSLPSLLATKLVERVNATDVPSAATAEDSVVVIPDDTPVILTLFAVEYIPWSLCLICTTLLPSAITIGLASSLRPYTVVPLSSVTSSPIISLFNVTVPVVVLNVALCNLNFKSWDWTADHAVLFWDLNKEPMCGCLETKRFEPDTSGLPISDVHTRYSKLFVRITTQYSIPSSKNTGESKVNDVADDPVVASTFTDDGANDFLPNGTTLGPG